MTNPEEVRPTEGLCSWCGQPLIVGGTLGEGTHEGTRYYANPDGSEHACIPSLPASAPSTRPNDYCECGHMRYIHEAGGTGMCALAVADCNCNAFTLRLRSTPPHNSWQDLDAEAFRKARNASASPAPATEPEKWDYQVGPFPRVAASRAPSPTPSAPVDDEARQWVDDEKVWTDPVGTVDLIHRLADALSETGAAFERQLVRANEARSRLALATADTERITWIQKADVALSPYHLCGRDGSTVRLRDGRDFDAATLRTAIDAARSSSLTDTPEGA